MAKSDDSRNLLKLIGRLSATDAIEVPRILTRDKNLTARIRPIMEKHLTQKAPQSLEEAQELAAEVLEDLENLEVEEVWDRAGPKHHGYVEPVEIADAISISEKPGLVLHVR